MNNFTPNHNATPESRAQVVYNNYSDTDERFVGLTVSQIRFTRQAWGIPDDARAYLGGSAVSEDYTVTAGDRIEFVRSQGDKG